MMYVLPQRRGKEQEYSAMYEQRIGCRRKRASSRPDDEQARPIERRRKTMDDETNDGRSK